jgi:transcriptional regulator with XRE-family HTH domain
MPTPTPDNAEPRGWLELIHFRERDGWSRATLAAAANLNAETLRLYENGKRNPTPDTIRRLADAMRVPYSVLMPSPRDVDTAADGERTDEEGAA